jgi:hypothetical protein
MGIEVRVCCEHPGCEETAQAIAPTDDLSSTTIIQRIGGDYGDRFHFVIDSDWINAPEGWTLGEEDQILCPQHARTEAEASSPPAQPPSE